MIVNHLDKRLAMALNGPMTDRSIPAARIIHCPLAYKPWNVEVYWAGEWDFVGCYATRAAAERRVANEGQRFASQVTA